MEADATVQHERAVKILIYTQVQRALRRGPHQSISFKVRAIGYVMRLGPGHKDGSPFRSERLEFGLRDRHQEPDPTGHGRRDSAESARERAEELG